MDFFKKLVQVWHASGFLKYAVIPPTFVACAFIYYDVAMQHAHLAYLNESEQVTYEYLNPGTTLPDRKELTFSPDPKRLARLRLKIKIQEDELQKSSKL
jgi:hypothetical protein